MSLAARTRSALGIAPLPRPTYVRRERQPAPQVVEPRRRLPKRHHPCLDQTAIIVRRVHMSLDGRCYCCETSVDAGWLCGECIELGCAETNRGVPTASTLPPGRVGSTPEADGLSGPSASGVSPAAADPLGSSSHHHRVGGGTPSEGAA